MKTSLVAVVLAVSAMGVGQAAAPQSPAQPAPAQQSQPQPQTQHPQQNLADAAQYADRGLQALKTAAKPEGMSDADFEKLKSQMSTIFNGVAGIAALQSKNLPQAEEHLRAAVQGDPNDLRNVYP